MRPLRPPAPIRHLGLRGTPGMERALPAGRGAAAASGPRAPPRMARAASARGEGPPGAPVGNVASRGWGRTGGRSARPLRRVAPSGRPAFSTPRASPPSGMRAGRPDRPAGVRPAGVRRADDACAPTTAKLLPMGGDPVRSAAPAGPQRRPGQARAGARARVAAARAAAPPPDGRGIRHRRGRSPGPGLDAILTRSRAILRRCLHPPPILPPRVRSARGPRGPAAARWWTPGHNRPRLAPPPGAANVPALPRAAGGRAERRRPPRSRPARGRDAADRTTGMDGVER